MWHTFMWLLVGHAVADYPLQGDFLAKAKNGWSPIPGIDWRIAMAAHCVIHAGVVAFVTHSWSLGLLEFSAHFVIDCFKCQGHMSFKQDQVLHVLCKVIWIIL